MPKAKLITVNGTTKTADEWAAASRGKISVATIRRRLRNGMDAEKAVTKPAISRSAAGRIGSKAGRNKNWKLLNH